MYVVWYVHDKINYSVHDKSGLKRDILATAMILAASVLYEYCDLSTIIDYLLILLCSSPENHHLLVDPLADKLHAHFPQVLRGLHVLGDEAGPPLLQVLERGNRHVQYIT